MTQALPVIRSAGVSPGTSARSRAANNADDNGDGHSTIQVRPGCPHGMPQRGHRVFATTTVRVSKTVHAPLRYVYDWCTDYRSDDGRLGRKGAIKPRFRVLRISPHRVVRVRLAPNGSHDPDIAVDVVRLHPPADWHTDQIDETDRMALDYHLVRLGPRKTRLELYVTERWVTRDFPTPRELRRRVSATWGRLATAIEERYRARAPARG